MRPCESTEDATEAREARSESRSPEDVVSLLLVEALSVQHVLGRGGEQGAGDYQGSHHSAIENST